MTAAETGRRRTSERLSRGHSPQPPALPSGRAPPTACVRRVPPSAHRAARSARGVARRRRRRIELDPECLPAVDPDHTPSQDPRQVFEGRLEQRGALAREGRHPDHPVAVGPADGGEDAHRGHARPCCSARGLPQGRAASQRPPSSRSRRMSLKSRARPDRYTARERARWSATGTVRGSSAEHLRTESMPDR